MRFIGAGPFKALCQEYGSMMNYGQEMDCQIQLVNLAV